MRAPGDRPHAIDVSEIAAMLNARIEELAYHLFPAARRDGHHLCVGSLAGEPGQSLKIEIRGPRQGGWRDFANPDGAEGHGDALHLVRHVLCGGDMADAIRWAKSWLGLDHLDERRLEQRREEARAQVRENASKAEEERALKRRRAVAMWMGGAPIAGTPAERYLQARGIRLSAKGLDHWPGSLRFVAEAWHSGERVKMPAMVACMVMPDGKHVATHRTFLEFRAGEGWAKLSSANAKMVLGSCGGAFVPLRKGASGKSLGEAPAGEWMHLAEGIEDALTGAMARPELRVGAAYSLGNMGTIELPARLGGLTFWADRDAPGSAAVDQLERSIARQQARGTAVKLVMPPIGQKDLNAWLQALVTEAERGAHVRGLA